MNTSNYFIELLITGAGTVVAILLISLGLWGLWIPFDILLRDSTLIGILILIFPIVYTIGIVTDRLVDSLYDNWFGDRMILAPFHDGKDDIRKANEATKRQALRRYGAARSKIYLTSDSLKQVFEYGRMRIRITRSWSFNSIFIWVGTQFTIWSPLVPFSSVGERLSIAVFISILLLISSVVSFRAWQQLVRKECGFLRMQSELIDEMSIKPR